MRTQVDIVSMVALAMRKLTEDRHPDQEKKGQVCLLVVLHNKLIAPTLKQ